MLSAYHNQFVYHINNTEVQENNFQELFFLPSTIRAFPYITQHS